MSEIPLERGSDRTVTRQLIDGVRRLVQDGRLPEGTRLPSTRSLASGLGISRNVAAIAYDQLAAEGYLAAKRGAGTFVAAGAAVDGRPTVPIPVPPPMREGLARAIRFNAGSPDIASFPVTAWAASLKRATLAAREADFGYASVQGSAELRREIASYLHRARGIRCAADLIVVVSGVSQAACLLAGLCGPGRRRAIVEDPALDYVRAALERGGCELLPVAADEAGLRTQELPPRPEAGLIYAVPSHQYPLGGILPIQRRVRLIEYARREGILIMEDDYDSEFRYEGASVEPLQALAPELVVYFGTFSKTLYPAIRLGYLVLPPRLVEPVLDAKRRLNLFSAGLEQLALAEWLGDGRFEAHVYKMKKLYGKRRERVVLRLREAFGEGARVLGEKAGLHLLVEFAEGIADAEAPRRCAEAGLELDWVEESALVKGRHPGRVVIGYGCLSDDQMDEGIRRLKEALDP